MRRLPPRPVAVIEREQERQAQARRVRLTDPEAPRDRRLAKARSDQQKATEARARTTGLGDASVPMRELRTPGSSLRTLARAVLAEGLAADGDVDPNHVRARLRPGGVWHHAISPRGISGHYASLCGLDLIKVTGRTTITGDSGGNGGKRVLRYALTHRGYRVLSDLFDGDPAPALPDDTDDDLFSDLMDGDE